MDMIAHRINSTYYKGLDAFVADFKLMFDNAMTYNQEGSVVYNDAVALKNAFYSVLQMMCPDGQPRILESDKQAAEEKAQALGKRPRSDLTDDDGQVKIKLNIGKKPKVAESEDDEHMEEADEDNE